MAGQWVAGQWVAVRGLRVAETQEESRRRAGREDRVGRELEGRTSGLEGDGQYVFIVGGFVQLLRAVVTALGEKWRSRSPPARSTDCPL